MRYLSASGFNSLAMVGLVLLAAISVLTAFILNVSKRRSGKGKRMSEVEYATGMLGLPDVLIYTSVVTLKEVSIGATAAALSS